MGPDSISEARFASTWLSVSGSAPLMSRNARPGRVLGGKYRLIQPITRGAMGAIWRAEHLELGCPLAVKLLVGGVPDSESRERFVREARTAAALRGPNVVQVLDYGLDEQTPYLVMELLSGESLQQRLTRSTRLSRRETARLLSQVAGALERAHGLGFVHRDLSANNVFLVEESGQTCAKLLDFGIAKSLEHTLPGDRTLTLRGVILGTPRYMSPEQVEGAPVDFRTDLWALGVLAFECLLGRAPFRGETFGSLVLAICSRAVPVPSQLGNVPAAFDEWFAQACAREPSERFASAEAAARALRRCLRSA